MTGSFDVFLAVGDLSILSSHFPSGRREFQSVFKICGGDGDGVKRDTRFSSQMGCNESSQDEVLRL